MPTRAGSRRWGVAHTVNGRSLDGVPRRSRGRRAVHAPVSPDLIAPSFVFAGGEGWGYAPSRPLAGAPHGIAPFFHGQKTKVHSPRPPCINAAAAVFGFYCTPLGADVRPAVHKTVFASWIKTGGAGARGGWSRPRAATPPRPPQALGSLGGPHAATPPPRGISRGHGYARPLPRAALTSPAVP